LLAQLDSNILQEQLEKFEVAFKSLNPSKINLGKFRRELSKEFIKDLDQYINFSIEELDEAFFQLTTTE
jgi:hypothetical protein